MKQNIPLLNAAAMTTVLAFSGMVAQAQDGGSKPASAENPAAALQHRYSFTTDASDSVGHAEGTLEGAASISGGQVHLNGTRGTYVNLPGGLIAGDSAITFEFWATLGADRNWVRVFDQGSTNGNNGGHDLYFCPHSGARDFRLTIMDPHPTERVVTVPGNLDNQTNLHIACVLDPASWFMGIYTNGMLAASRKDLVSLLSEVTNVFFLGGLLFATDPPLNGSIDEFRIYDAALSAAAIAASYRNGPDAALPARLSRRSQSAATHKLPQVLPFAFQQRAPKRALKVLAWVGACRGGLRIIGLILSSISVNLFASVAFREVTAAERFRRDFGWSRKLLDSDPRLHIKCL